MLRITLSYTAIIVILYVKYALVSTFGLFLVVGFWFKGYLTGSVSTLETELNIIFFHVKNIRCRGHGIDRRYFSPL